MRKIAREEMEVGTPVLTIEMPYEVFVAKFGEHHLDHPQDWDAPVPVELWFFELPWGLKIALEYFLSMCVFNIHTERFELDAILDYLNLREFECQRWEETIELLKLRYPIYIDGLASTNLYRLDDNGNTVLMRTYESPRVAEYYAKLYESRGHKQMYWTETAPAETHGRNA